MTRQVTSLVLLFTPVIVLNALRFIVEPLGSRVAVAVEDRLRRFKAQAAKRRKKT